LKNERNEFVKEPSDPRTRFPFRIYRYKATVDDDRDYEYHYGYMNGASRSEAKERALAHVQDVHPQAKVSISRITYVSDEEFNRRYEKKYGKDVLSQVDYYGVDKIHFATAKGRRRNGLSKKEMKEWRKRREQG
jgi:hypothetical protein